MPLAAESRVERDDGLAARQSERLQVVMDDVEQMMVVKGVYLYEHIVVTGCVVAFHDFRNAFQLLTTPSPVLLQVDSVSIDECANYKSCYDKASKKLKSIKKFNGFVFNAKNTVTNQNEKYICEANTPKTRFPFVCKIVK